MVYYEEYKDDPQHGVMVLGVGVLGGGVRCTRIMLCLGNTILVLGKGFTHPPYRAWTYLESLKKVLWMLTQLRGLVDAGLLGSIVDIDVDKLLGCRVCLGLCFTSSVVVLSKSAKVWMGGSTNVVAVICDSHWCEYRLLLIFRYQ